MEEHSVSISEEIVRFQLNRSERKTLGISVAPDQSVLVTAPTTANLPAIKDRVKRRAGWILDKQAEFGNRSIDASPRLFKPGETFLHLGNQYRLKVDPSTVGVVRDGSRIIVGAVQPGETARIRNRLVRWYAKESRHHLPVAFDRCADAFRHEIGKMPRLFIRPIKMRWGSYIPSSHSLILNRSLVQVSTPLIDYVVTHELAHMRHGHHGEAFAAYLADKMPDWKQRKRALERIAPELFDAPILR